MKVSNSEEKHKQTCIEFGLQAWGLQSTAPAPSAGSGWAQGPLRAALAAGHASHTESRSWCLWPCPSQELLKRTEEKREERKKERLADYYRRNYKGGRLVAE